MTPIVLVENEVTAGGRYDHWQDVTGERYQFPNQYRGKVIEGRRFVYYRGVRRADSSRGTAEYFGCGVIGSVSLDPTIDQSLPKARWKWICTVDDYQPFPIPVSAKDGDTYLEEIPQNFWGVGVREISDSVYSRIVERAGLAVHAAELPVPLLKLPPIEVVQPQTAASLLIPSPAATNARTQQTGNATSRRSRYSAALGRRGEEVVLKHLRSVLPPEDAATLRWVASEGETPGWDIEYVSDGQLTVIEVKATGGPAFPSLELTANEWNAAARLRARYRLALVAQVKAASPLIQIIDNPQRLVAEGQIDVEPTVWRLVWRGSAWH